MRAGKFTIKGTSLGGIATSIYVPELRALFDVGHVVPEALGARYLFVSHAHIDHLGALVPFLARRALAGVEAPLKVFIPASIEAAVRAAVAVLNMLHSEALAPDLVPMVPGQEIELDGGRFVRAFRTYHRVASLGYHIFERRVKVRPEARKLPSAALKAARIAGDAEVFEEVEHGLLAYATDTTAKILGSLEPVDTLILECTYLDDQRSVERARQGGHIHLDELVKAEIPAKHLVLMHFSQMCAPTQVREILTARLPRALPLLPE